MKKILLFGLILSFGLISFAQKSSSLKTKEQMQIKGTAVYNPNKIGGLGNLEHPVNHMVSKSTKLEEFEQIGITEYDFQSNANVDNRFCMFPDGTMAAVWTYGPAGGELAAPERGTGYNYFDGSSWGSAPTERIESDRAGWPSIAPWGENGEIKVSHAWGGSTYLDGGLIINTRPTKGTGDWTESIFLGPAGFIAAWPRMVTSGEDNMNVHIIHCLNAEYNGMTDALLYSRSIDGGTNWDILHLQIDGITADEYNGIGGDGYTFANPVGETIAFVISDIWDIDLVVMKSDNSGEDWEKIVVWEHPYPFWNWDETLTDSMWAPDGTASIALDPSGKVHLVSGIVKVSHDEPGDTYGFWPYGEGIIYWNEDMDPFEADDQAMALDAMYGNGVIVEDVNYIGWGQDMDGDGEFTIINAPEGLHSYRNGGATTMPAIACGDNGEVAVAFSGIAETAIYNSDPEMNFRRIWTRKSYDNGATWTPHYNINTDITQSFDECVYSTLNKTIDGEFHLIYQADYDVGTALDDDWHGWVENRIIYYHDFIVGMNDRPEADRFISVSQNYPNPATTTTRVNVDLPVTNVNLSIEVSNMVGQVVYTEDKGTVSNSQNSFVINVADFKPGVYFYTIKVNEESVTHKMIVE